MKRLATAALLGACAAAAAVAPAYSAFPGENGKIVFEESNSTWVVNASGTALYRLPWRVPDLGPNEWVEVVNPEVTPDGTRAVVTVSTFVERAVSAGVTSSSRL